MNVQLPGPTADSEPFNETPDAATLLFTRSMTKVKARYTNSTGVSQVTDAELGTDGIARLTGMDFVVGKNAALHSSSWQTSTLLQQVL